MNSWDEADPESPLSAGEAGTQPGEPGVSGRAVVMGMFAFGVLATAGMWLYWELHTRPFRPLQQALVVEFPGSNPRVQGGQARMHKGTPRILQVVMRVAFDPVADESQAEQIAGRVVELTRQHHDMTGYDRIEVGLFQPVPEEDPRLRTVRFDVGHVASVPE